MANGEPANKRLRTANESESNFLVMAHSSISGLAEELVRSNPMRYEKIEVNWKEFESGMPNIFIPEVHRLPQKNVLLLVNFRSKEILLDQLAVIYAIPRYGCRSFTVCLPFFPTGTMERIDQEGEVATAATLSRMLSATPLTPSGPCKFLIFDIHALQIRFYFQDSILPVLLTAMPLLKNVLQKRYKDEKVAIAFPDEGAKKRFGGFFAKEGYPILFCSKVREGDKRVVRIAEGNAQDHHVVIVDDLCNTGGTVIACRDALSSGGAAKVSVFVTHGVFPQESWRKFEKAGFEKIFITDSIPETVKAFQQHVATHGQASPFEVISLAPLLDQYVSTI